MSKTSRFCFLFALGLFACFSVSCNKEIDPDSPMPLDYALQTIPPIDEVIPADLIQAMSPYLNFGDNPPRIDTCFCALDSLYLAQFIHNTDIDPTSSYNPVPQTITYPRHDFRFHGQHRGVADLYQYQRTYGPLSPGTEIIIYENATVKDNVYIMGSGNKFTAYFRQSAKKRIEPEGSINISDFDIVREESVIITGQITSTGITDFHIGTRTESYDRESVMIGTSGNNPQVHDILIFDYFGRTLPFDTFSSSESNNQ